MEKTDEKLDENTTAQVGGRRNAVVYRLGGAANVYSLWPPLSVLLPQVSRFTPPAADHTRSVSTDNRDTPKYTDSVTRARRRAPSVARARRGDHFDG